MRKIIFILFFCIFILNVYGDEYPDSVIDGRCFQIDDSLLNLTNPMATLHAPRRIVTNPDSTFEHWEKFYFTPKSSLDKNILILVSKSIYNNIHFEIKRYAEDVHAIYGYGVICEVVKNGSPVQIKSIILSHSNICGAVFVGDLGEAYYENSNDFNGYYRNWPCDLFFMDLDGLWADNDSNGLYDQHTGDVKPEIFVARLCGANVHSIGEEIELTRRQFNKSHSFWWDSSYFTPDTILNYVYSDWLNTFPVSHIAPVLDNGNVTYIRHSVDSCFSSNDYKSRICNGNLTFTHLAAHSAPTFHQIPPGNIYASQLLNNNSKNIAYNLFCCSACDWTANNNYYLGAVYLFEGAKTLAVVGSTKTGSMLSSRYFYQYFSMYNIGESMLNWWNYYGNNHNNSIIRWYYGMVLLGDPTINFRHNVSNYCVNDLVLNSYPSNDESNLIMYKAGKTITVKSGFVIPNGVHVIFDAPKVIFDKGFSCPKGATFETRNEGCKL